MGLYDELNDRKQNGDNLRFEDITATQLRQLFIDEKISDRLIGELFDVRPSKVTYRRKKLGITIYNSIICQVLDASTEEARELNLDIKKEIMKSENLTRISRALTHFVFRNGPIEDMHSDPDIQLSDEDMKVLNIFANNRMAYVLTLIMEDRWIEFDHLIGIYGVHGQGWYEPIPDDGGVREITEQLFYHKTNL